MSLVSTIGFCLLFVLFVFVSFGWFLLLFGIFFFVFCGRFLFVLVWFG